MTLKTLKVLLIISFLIQVSHAQQNYLDKDDLLNDANFLFQKIEKIHPNMYYSMSKESFEEELKAIKSKINDSLDVFDFYKLINPLVVKLNDGHTALRFPFKQFKELNPSVFPFSVHVNPKDSAVIVKKDFTQVKNSIPEGSTIVSINGIPIEKIVGNMMENISGEKGHFKIAVLPYLFTPFLYAFYRDNDFQIEYLNGKQLKNTTVYGISYEHRFQRQDRSKKPEPYTLKIDEDRQIAIINFREFSNPKKFRRFLKSTFMEIQQHRIIHLIIDVRYNGGGNSSLGDQLFQYISKKPFNQYGKTLVKTKGKVKKHTSKLKKLRKNKLKFNGKVFVLQSNYTFSSASDFTWAFKYFDMGDIIGEESGGLAVCYGEVILKELPHTGLGFGVSSKKFYNYGATDKNTHGTFPDYEVPAAKALNFTMELIKKTKKQP